MRLAVGLVALWLVACSPDRVLLVQLVSNMTPGREIDTAHVAVTDASGNEVARVDTPLRGTLGRPVRIASFTGVGAGAHRVTVTLRLRGDEIQTRRVDRELGDTTIVTVLMTRDCNGVVCPGTGDPAAVECLGSRCVEPTCDEEHPELCPMPQCRTSADCMASSVACAPMECSASGVCFARADDSLCDPGVRCDVQNGCLPGGCDPTAPFGEPTLITELASSSANLTLRLTANELTGVYWSYATWPEAEVYVVSRARITDVLTSTPAIGLSSPGLDEDPTIEADGSRIVFSSDRAGGGDLYESTLVTAPATFAAPVALTSLNTASDEAQPFLTATHLYFGSDRSGVLQPYGALRTGPGAYGPAEPVSELWSGTLDSDMVLTPDERVVYFRSRRLTGTDDVFRATRTRTSDPFGAPELVAEVSSPTASEGPSWVSPDDCRLYLASDRGGGLPQLYVAERP